MRRRTIAVLAVVGIWWLRRGGSEVAQPRPHPQAAVLRDGFTALVGPRDVHDSWRVIELARDGKQRTLKALRRDGEVRLVGLPEGTGVAWREAGRVSLATLDRDGNPDEISTWGKQATLLCDGAATNEHRFAVGWLERDGRMWMVHGPLAPGAVEALEPIVAAESVTGDWCGIASAERKIAMLWRDGGRLHMNLCGPKSCDGRVIRVPIDQRDTLLGFGCVGDGCLFATRDPRGATRLHRVTEKGRTIAVAVGDARADTVFSIVGAGGRAFAISYVAQDGRATIQRITTEGEITDTWHFENADAAPAIAWAAGRLVVVYAEHASEQLYVLDVAG